MGSIHVIIISLEQCENYEESIKGQKGKSARKVLEKWKVGLDEMEMFYAK